MSEPAQAREPLEDRAAKWLNGVMYYGLASLATAAGLWVLVGSFWDLNAFVESLSFNRAEVIDGDRAWIGLIILATGSTALLRSWEQKAAKSA